MLQSILARAFPLPRVSGRSRPLLPVQRARPGARPVRRSAGHPATPAASSSAGLGAAGTSGSGAFAANAGAVAAPFPRAASARVDGLEPAEPPAWAAGAAPGVRCNRRSTPCAAVPWRQTGLTGRAAARGDRFLGRRPRRGSAGAPAAGQRPAGHDRRCGTRRQRAPRGVSTGSSAADDSYATSAASSASSSISAGSTSSSRGSPWRPALQPPDRFLRRALRRTRRRSPRLLPRPVLPPRMRPCLRRAFARPVAARPKGCRACSGGRRRHPTKRLGGRGAAEWRGPTGRAGPRCSSPPRTAPAAAGRGS